MYKLIIRPILFLFDPEKVHYFTFSIIKFLNVIGFGIIFRNLFQIKNQNWKEKFLELNFQILLG